MPLHLYMVQGFSYALVSDVGEEFNSHPYKGRRFNWTALYMLTKVDIILFELFC